MRKYRLKNTVLFALSLFVGALTTGVLSAQIEQSDETIARAVSAELRHSNLIEYEQVQMTVEDGIVSLIGSVPTITASREFDDVTATVRGVRAIVNRLEVDSPLMSGTNLRDRVVAALKDDAATELYELDVAANDDGAVTLSGVVDSWAEFRLAETVVGTVAGVHEIENQIKVNASAHYRGEADIEADILERLHWDARVDESLISVLVRDGGRVTLSGTVGSVAEKRLAMSLAEVSGVHSVDAAHLDVEPWARDDDRRLGADRGVADMDIKMAIRRALQLDPRVAASDVDVTVVNGVVWLRGEVATISARKAADGDASNTRGARFVNNFVSVMPAAMDDAQIERQIENAISMIDRPIGDDVIVRVAGSQARIAGDVDSAESYRRIDEILANTRGIDSITNELTIRGEMPLIGGHAPMPQTSILLRGNSGGNGAGELSDRELYESVESELFWSPFVDGRNVEIDVDEGAVTLTGDVESMSESMAAEANAFQAGARIVNNALEVE